MSKECVDKCEKSIDEAIFDFVYREAMDDAVRRTPFLSDENEKRKSIDELVTCDIDEAVNKAKKAVKDHIEKILKGVYKKESDYKSAFDNTIKEIVGDGENVSETLGKYNFTFGNAQKLLNMCVKHYYIITVNKNGDTKRECFEHCHCPMDRRMVTMVRKNYKKMKGIPLNKRIPDIDCGDTEDWSGVSWSKIQIKGSVSINYYNKFQAMVKELAESEEISPIEYDYKYWKKF